MKTVILSLSLLFIVLVGYTEASCVCSTPSVPDVGDSGAVSQYDVVIDGVNYGKLITLYVGTNNIVFMQEDTIAKPLSDYNETNYNCPRGFRPPTLDELTAVTKDPNFLNGIFNADQNATYISSQKTYDVNTGSSQDWEYLCLQWINNIPSIVSASTQTAYDLKTKCVFAVERENIEVSGLPLDNALVGDLLNLSVTSANVVSCVWNLPTGEILSSTCSASYNSSTYGCFGISVSVRFFGQSTLTSCLNLWFSSRASPLTSIFDVQTRVVARDATHASMVHTNHATAPIAPRSDGGAYIFYSNLNSDLIVLQVDRSGNVLAVFNKLGQGYPFDIIAIPSSDDFVVMVHDLKDVNDLYFMRVDSSGNPIWTIHMSSFGEFTDEWGMENMFQPLNGRLQYNNGLIVAIFAHSDNFGDNYDGTPMIHDGDTIITINPVDQTMTVVNSWGASHSLIQQLQCDAQTNQCIAASLGDAYPENILVATISSSWVYNCTDQLITGYIPGNGRHVSCGRLGGLLVLPSEYAVVYQRSACNNNSFAGYDNPTTEIGLVFFDQNLVVSRYVSLQDLPEIANVFTVKAVTFASVIVVGYVITLATRDDSTSDVYDESVSEMYLLVLDLTGNIITPCFQAPLSFTPSDDMEVLADGTLAWMYVSPKGELIMNTVNPLDMPGTSGTDSPSDTTNPAAGCGACLYNDINCYASTCIWDATYQGKKISVPYTLNANEGTRWCVTAVNIDREMTAWGRVDESDADCPAPTDGLQSLVDSPVIGFKMAGTSPQVILGVIIALLVLIAAVVLVILKVNSKKGFRPTETSDTSINFSPFATQ